MPSLFISYRRADSPDTVKLIYERLKKRLPRWEIFYDHEGIALGEQFPERLRDKLTAATAVLVIVGPKWVEIFHERKSASIDHVREEVRLALETGASVVPVLAGRADMPTDADLADFADLQPLLKRNGRPVRPDPDFDSDLEPIVAHLKSLDSAEAVGTILDDKYTLTQYIDEGGMGVVYAAQQKQPVQRMVAIKLIKPGMDSRDVLARFDAERQALAVMDHPNVAKVLDAGMTAHGRPYFVMEYVKGIPITQYCDDKKLTPQERLNLFIPVCNAVQHAHQKGIIHRDLKPSNVLVEVVDGKPVPKVIDFGLAKALGQKLTDKTLHTALEMRVGTLEYSAPEQAAGRSFDVDTRSDIYSLGVLLYDLLTGAPPFTREELLKIGEEEMRRVIREDVPTTPSKKLSSSGELPAIAAKRHLEPTTLTRMVQGDLDWIVMKCLEKENARRYETANQLGEELGRFLADEPVKAGPPSASYRVKKFLRRNRGPVIAASLVFLALVLGIIGTSIGLAQAESARVKADAALVAESIARTEADKNLKIAKENERRAEKNEQLAKERLARIEKIVGAAVDETTLPQFADAVNAAMKKLPPIPKAATFEDLNARRIELEKDPALAKRVEAAQAELKAIFDANLKDEKAIRAMLKPSSVPGLIVMLKDSDRQVRLKAVQLVGIMGADAKAAIPALIETCKDPDAFVRGNAIFALGAMGPDAAPALPVLREALRDEAMFGFVSVTASVVIGKLGASAKPAVPDLIALLRRRSAVGTIAALAALENLGPVAADAAPAVIEVLNESREPTVHTGCLRFLAKLGPAAAPAVPALIAILKGDDLDLQGWACEILSNCPKEATKAVPELIKASSADVLDFIGLSPKERNLGYWATRALANLEPPAASAGPALKDRLSSFNTNTRSWAAYGLGRMESKAAPFLPELRKARENETDPNNRKTMDEAIAKITKK